MRWIFTLSYPTDARMSDRLGRRAFIGTAAAAGAGLLAGCGGSSEDSPESTGSEQQSVDSYLEDTANYDGTVVDETGADAVSVDVGAEGNGGNLAFAPAAIKVDAGTTVTWVWTGKGSNHNVVDEGGAFDSKQVASEGYEFTHTFEESGRFLYYCLPHKAVGMKGAVVVE